VARTAVQLLDEFGQSVWIDYISRSLLNSGRLKELIGRGVRGLTSNPTIFDKAISGSSEYDQLIRTLKEGRGCTFEIYDDITVKDIQDAADLFRPIYEDTKGLDGYVSLEINPELANDTEKTIAEGKRLHAKVARPNVMFKVPATEAGFPAIAELLAGGINVNVTLIFSLEQYVSAADAYLRGIECLLEKGGVAERVCSVASVFVSRVDTLVDDLIEQQLNAVSDARERERLGKLRGMAAVANAAIIYDRYSQIFSDKKFETLRKRGGNIQRLLWGSTSTKNPAYCDIKYVAELIGRGTVNTIPQKTLEAFLDHGQVKEALPGDLEQARVIIETLANHGIEIDAVCGRLLKDGVIAFQDSFSSLLKAIEGKAAKL
jgi:transaldolase